MRKVLVVATALVAVLAAAPVANAGSKITQTVDVSLGSAKAGKNTTATVTFNTKTADGTALSPGTFTALTFPSGFKFNTSKFKSCSESQVPDNCPSGSQIGSGSATVDAPPVATGISATVKAFNGGGGKIYLAALVTNPVTVTSTLSGKFSGTKLNVTIPALPTLPGQPNASIPKFQVKITKSAFITTSKTCTGSWTFTAKSKYEDGQSTTATDKVKCKKS